jgi:hypothetical protein
MTNHAAGGIEEEAGSGAEESSNLTYVPEIMEVQ